MLRHEWRFTPPPSAIPYRLEHMMSLNAIDWVFEDVGKFFRYHKFGESPALSSGTNEVVSDLGSSQTYATSAATTTIVSTSTADDSAGTGARTVVVEGVLDSSKNYQMKREEVTMDGTTAVTLSTQFYFVHRIKVLTAGSGNANAGDITVSIDGNAVAKVVAGNNQTLMAVFYAPGRDFAGNDYAKVELYTWYGSILRTAATSANFSIWEVSPGGTVWNVQDKRGIQSTGTTTDAWERPIEMSPGSGLRVMCEPSANGTIATGGFMMHFHI